MKALVQSDYGDPGKVLKIRDDSPEPQAGEGEVVIDMEAAVVQVADVRTIAGANGFRKKLPRTPGYEGVGRVHSVGKNVTGLTVGTRVFAPIGCGTFRERVAVAAEGLTLAPEGDAVTVASLSFAPAAAFMMLQDFAQLTPDDWIVQNAANSPVGRMVVQLARELNLKLVNVVKSTSLIRELKDIGAGAVVVDGDDLRERVVAVTLGKPVKLVLDAVGGVATARLSECLSDEGNIVNYGALSGEPCQVPSEHLATHGIRLIGMNPSRQLARHTPEERQAICARIGELMVAQKLQARIAATYGLNQSIDAVRHALSAGDKRFGKVMIRIKEEVVAAAAPAPAAPNPADSAPPTAAPAPHAEPAAAASLQEEPLKVAAAS